MILPRFARIIYFNFPLSTFRFPLKQKGRPGNRDGL